MFFGSWTGQLELETNKHCRCSPNSFSFRSKGLKLKDLRIQSIGPSFSYPFNPGLWRGILVPAQPKLKLLAFPLLLHARLIIFLKSSFQNIIWGNSGSVLSNNLQPNLLFPLTFIFQIFRFTPVCTKCQENKISSLDFSYVYNFHLCLIE